MLWFWICRVTQPRNRSLRAESELAIRPCSSCIWFVYVYKLNKALPDYFASFSTKRYQIPLSYFMWFEIQNSKTFTKMSNLLTHCLQNVVEFRERKKERHFVTWYAKFFQLANNAVVWSPTPEFKTLTIIFTWEGFRFAWQHFKILCTSNKKNKIR